MPAFSATAELSGTAPPLSNAHHAGFDSMPDRGGNLLRSDFFDSAQEKGFGFDGNAVGHRGNGFGRIKRTDQRNSARWAGNRSGLVFARFVFDGTDLRATGKNLAAVSKTRNIQEGVDFGRGVFHVHSSPAANIIFSGFIARYPSH